MMTYTRTRGAKPMMGPRPTNLPLYSCFDVQLPPYATGPISTAGRAKTPRPAHLCVQLLRRSSVGLKLGSKAIAFALRPEVRRRLLLWGPRSTAVRAKPLVVHATARVTEHTILYRHKLPVVSVGLQVEPDHTVGLGAADLAVRLRVLEGVQALAPVPTTNSRSPRWGSG